MTVNSMTGYGRSEFLLNGVTYRVEVRSLNHRYLDMRLRVPDSFFCLEGRMRKEVKKRFHRGTFNLSIISHESEKGATGLEVNESLAKEYLTSLKRLQSNLGIEGKIDIGLLLELKGVITQRQESVNEENWVIVEEGLNMALDDLVEMRRIEGTALRDDIGKRLNGLQQYLSDIEKRYSPIQNEYMERLKERLRGLTEDCEIDDNRIFQEMALLVERSDVTEEITRLRAHIDQFRETLKETSPVGRKMDFICQEMVREVNTIGSKSIDVTISSLVVELKSDIDRIKEQVQNIE